MRNRRCGRARSALLAVVLSGVLASAASAQQKQTFDIPAQEAAVAIQSWARQSGLQVFAAEDDLRGVRTNPVRGDFGAVEAAQMLVAGTGLEVVATGENTVTIRRSRPSGAPATPPGEKFGSPQTEELMEVIVTGTRIRRAGFDTLQATMTSDAEQIERRGYTNVAEAVNALPGFGGSGADPVGTTQMTNNIGQSFVNLFNLGSQRTLVLVNGRRYVTSGTPALGQPAGLQVDLNTIPVGLIDRVEVVSIGGAPVYGSDAIAGTVNLILKKDFEGFLSSAQYGTTEAGGGDTKTFRTLIGGNFAADRGNVAVGFEYNEVDGLLYSDRYSGGFYTRVRNLADTGPNDGIPAFVVGALRYAALTENGLPYANALAPAFGNDFPGILRAPYTRPNYIYDAAGQPLQFDSSGTLIPYNRGTVLSRGAVPVEAMGGDGMNPGDHFSLLSPTRRTLINAIGHYDITEGVRAIFETSYAQSRGQELSDLNSFAAVGVLGGPRLTFSVNNPYLSAQARDILTANVGPNGTFDMNRNLNDLTDRSGARTQVDLYRMVGGFEGEFGAFDETFNWDIAFNYGRSRSVSDFSFINPTRLTQAIDVVTDGAGNPVCRNPANRCAPLNLFGGNNFSQAALDFVMDPATAITLNTQRVATTNLGGHLPFGVADNIAFNVGAEYREEQSSFRPDSAFQAGAVLFGPPGASGAAFPVAGKFDTKEVYTEMVAPLVSDEWRWPVIKSASLEGAVRYVDHSLTGSDTTWSAGARLAPRLPGWGDGLQLRGVYTEAIRSPAIRELFTNTPTTGNIGDPCTVTALSSGPNPAARRANCEAALRAVGVTNPAAYDNSTTTGRTNPSGSQVGNPNLDNEQAKSWSVGFVYQPTSLPRLRMAIDWSDVKLSGGISPLTIARQLALCYDSNTFPSDACSGFQRLTAADIAALPPNSPPRQVGDVANGYQATYFNLSTIHFQGLIAAIESDFDVGPGTARVGTTVSFTNKFEERAFASDPPINSAGLRGLPEYEVQLNLGYRWNQLDIDWQTLWTSAVETGLNVNPEEFQGTHIPSYATHHLTVGYQLTETLRAQVGVVNVLDEDIHVNALAGGFSGYDPIGRRYFMSVFADFR